MFILKHKAKILRGLILGLLGAVIFLVAFTNATEPILLVQKAQTNPVFMRYLNTMTQSQDSGSNQRLGWIPLPIDSSQISGPVLPDRAISTVIPAYFDLRTTDPIRVTPVKDQDPAGTCWAFATMASLESNLLPSETWDFSENNLKNNSGRSMNANNSGGNFFMSTAYLARWSGPISETDDPYDGTTVTHPSGLAALKHIQNVYFLPDRNSALIKQAIMTYGAVCTSMYWDNICYNSSTHAYYEPRTRWNNYYYGNNHAVTIVGWDDNYPKANFKADGNSIPAGNGAWIVKNSWGTGWGDSGYFYLSYNDNNTPRVNAVFLKPEATNNYKRIYQYDPLGAVDFFGFRSTTGWMSNIFTAAADEPLVAVSFYAMAANSSYTIKIYTNGTLNNPISGTLACTQTGTITYAGYHTISLVSSPVILTAGQNYSVVIKLTTPGWNYPIALEDQGYYAYPTASNRSFTSTNGTKWDDPNNYTDYYGNQIFNNADCCIKAFTRTAPCISTQPASQTVDAQTNATFTVTAFSTSALTYQWYFGDNPIPNANSATLTLNNVSPANNGVYTVIVTNTEGTATSQPATLTVRPLLPPPILDLQPGTYTTPQNVSVFYPPDYTGVTIRYTLDGKEPTAISPIFSLVTPLKIIKTTTLKVKAWKTDFTPSRTVTTEYTVTGIVAIPTFSLPSGAYSNSTTVSLKCASPVGAIIRYTTDGTEPTNTDLEYTGPITITNDITLKAKAWLINWETSATANATYTVIKIANPTFSIAPGIYPSVQTVLIKCSTPGVTIRYTIDGSTPTRTNGIVGTSAQIKTNCTLQAIAYRTGYTDSDPVSSDYYIGKVAAPVFGLPPTKIYNVSDSISINCATPDAVIRYTMDGSTPNNGSLIYSDPIPLDRPMAIKAIAFKTNMVSSAVTSANYNLYFPNKPAFDVIAGAYNSEQTVTITCVDPDAVIRYTTTGIPPTATSTSIVSGGVVQIGKTMTLMAKAFKPNWAPSDTMIAKYTIQTSGMVAAPTFNPAPGTCLIGSYIAINGPPGAEIRYTTDGTIPTGASTLYNSEFPITFIEPKVIKAKAFITGMASSAVITGTFNAVLPRPEFSPVTGTGEQTITIICAEGDATIRYTINGTEPISTSPIAVGGTVLVNKSMTLKAKAFKTGWLSSPTQTAAFIVTQVATPVFNVAEGTYGLAQRVLISCATTGAMIRYTTDGSDPTTGSPVYPTTGITISATKTLKAIAIKAGMTDSNIKTVTYTITGKVATPTFYCMSNNIRAINATYASGIWVYVNCATEDAEIHYTTNGLEPTINDPAVAPGSALLFEASVNLKAKAFKDTWLPSDTQTAIYTILQVATPEITIQDEIATITCATPGAVIRYTTNGNEPSLSDTVVTPGVTIPVNSGITLKTKAWKTGLAPSQIAVATLQYTLTITADENGSAAPSGLFAVNHGAITAITATPAENYQFVKWIKTAGTGTVFFANANAANTTVKVTGGDATICAAFAIRQYTLTINNNGNGRTSPTGVMRVIHDAGMVINATPAMGYLFENWTQTAGTGTAIFGDANAANTTVTVTGGDATIRANFSGGRMIIFTSDGNGSTTPSGVVTVENEADTAITARPDPGCQFINWTKTGGTGTLVFEDVYSINTTVKVTGGNVTIKANFARLLPLSTEVTGNMEAGDAKWYIFPAITGKKYAISWDDRYRSYNNYSCYVKVSAFQKDAVTAYFQEQYNGYYYPKTITALEDYIYILVQGSSSSSVGKFALRVIPQNILTVTNDGNGSTNPSGAVTMDDGASKTITASANTGCLFTNWTQTGGTGTVVFGNADAASTTVTVIGGDAVIQANYSAVSTFQYTLTVSNDGNGVTSPSGAVMVNNGISKEITAIPNSGYLFAGWTKTAGTGTVKFGNVNSANTTVTVTSGNATIRANFAILEPLPINTWISGNIIAGGIKLYRFQATVGAKYSISWDDYYTNSGIYTCRTKIGVYQKDLTTAYFSDASGSNNNPRTITALQDCFYILVQEYYSSGGGSFAVKVSSPIYTLTITNDGIGSTAPLSSVLVTEGISKTITAIPNAGCQFVNWTQTAGAGTVAFDDPFSTTVNVTVTGGSATIKANFSVNQTVLYALTVTDDGYGNTTPSGSIAVNNGLCTAIEATPNNSYRFNYWEKTSGNGTVVFGNRYSANTTVTVTSGDATIQAFFTIKQYTLTVVNDLNGNTSPSGSVTVTHGQSRAISATSNAGCQFVNWTKIAGNGTVVFSNPNSASTTVTITDGDAMIQANFNVNQTIQYTMTVNYDGSGIIDPSGAITVNNGVSTAISATPNTGFQFMNWTKTAGTGRVVFGNVYSADTNVTVFSGNATIRANFAEQLPFSSWVTGNISIGVSKWYCFKATIGTLYTISWDDYYQGPHIYQSGYCDVKVSAFHQDLSTAYFTGINSGYNYPQIITAQQEYVFIQVQGYYSNSYGSFAIRVN